MIKKLNDLPETLIGFEAKGDVVADDFKNHVMPDVAQFTDKHGYLNYMLVLETALSNFSVGAWLNDMVLGMKELKYWHRAAIISESDAVDIGTKIFNVFTIGEFKVFKHAEMEEAIAWASVPKQVEE